MSDPTTVGGPDFRPLSVPSRAERQRRIDWSDPFARLALTHGLGNGAEALLAIALAGSLFFKVDPAEGREKVLLALVLTMAPFAVVGPLIGPLMDRVKGGHRVVIIGSMALRCGIGVLMVRAVANGSITLFPEAFLMLVLGKTYQVAKAALVPTVVSDDGELIEANSKLQVLGGLAGFAAAAPGGLFFIAGPGWVMGFCVAVFGAATITSFRLPSGVVAEAPPETAETAELHAAGIVLAASAMAILRAIVGFSTFLLAFQLRGGSPMPAAERMARRAAAHLTIKGLHISEVASGPPKIYFGVVVGMGAIGGLIGATVAPRLHRFLAEERILLGSVGLGLVAGLSALLINGLGGYALLALLVSVAASAGKQAFDSLVQRDAPDANRGRAFARYESRFQVAWVIGAVVPAAITLPIGFGAVVIMIAAGLAGVSYAIGGFGQFSRSGKSGISTSPISGSD